MPEEHNRVITFGCRLNAYESKAIEAALTKSGQQNLLVFNSCAVTQQAERDLRASIRKARRENPQAKIVVTGCAAQIDPQKYAKMAEVDLVLGNQEKSQSTSYSFMSSSLGAKATEDLSPKSSALQAKDDACGDDVIEDAAVGDIAHKDRIFSDAKKSSQIFLEPHETAKIKVNDIMSLRETAPQLVSYFENQTRAFLEIQNGCNHRCTFCIIPFGRGNSRSVAFGEIVAQVKKMVAAGHKEVVLTGVDISGYGEDLSVPIKLSAMIKRLLALVPELSRLRLSSIDVAEMDDGFFDLLQNEPRFMPYFHLSLQSGDDMILKRMKRRHNRAQILEFCAKARQISSEVTFGADIIAGFPTEDEAMFENSLRLISEAGIIFTHIFPYSKRDGTPAAKMPQVDGKLIKQRAKLLREAGAAELQKFLAKQVGKNFEVLFEKNAAGKTKNFLDVKILGKIPQAGEALRIKALRVEENFLIGEIS